MLARWNQAETSLNATNSRRSTRGSRPATALCASGGNRVRPALGRDLRAERIPLVANAPDLPASASSRFRGPRPCISDAFLGGRRDAPGRGPRVREEGFFVRVEMSTRSRRRWVFGLLFWNRAGLFDAVRVPIQGSSPCAWGGRQDDRLGSEPQRRRRKTRLDRMETSGIGLFDAVRVPIQGSSPCAWGEGRMIASDRNPSGVE